MSNTNVKVGFVECWCCGEIFNLNTEEECPSCGSDPEDAPIPIIDEENQ